MSSSVQFQAYPVHAAQLIDAAIAAVDPATAVKRHLQRDGRTILVGTESYNLAEPGRVHLISVGKAAIPMALAAAEILGETLTAAILVAKKTARDWRLEIENSPLDPQSSRLFEAGHPIPNDESVRAGTAVLNLLAQTTDDDLVLFLISGGASALLARPLIPLDDWRQLTGALLASGCAINELNCIRRQLDRVKGGGLARAAAPAACASLILSDVIGNPLAAIGSGPTVFTDETPADAQAVLTRYNIEEKLETAVNQRIIAALRTEIGTKIEIAQPRRNQHLIVGDLNQAAAAVMTKAAQLGFIAQILTTQLEGEAREVGKVAAALAKDAPAGRCFILGGETTVTLRGQGQGGRNQELALAAAIALEGCPDRVIISFATDGEDGPTDAAGGIVTGETAVLAAINQLNPIACLDNNDSYTFFQQLETEIEAEVERIWRHHIKSGSTGTNVNDLVVILSYPKSITINE
ncbi:MAG: DUF4147 domain-containing protein [Chloroflexi bacterium]|nr:DUF4147 domain-containing protein [Chloroflexota bacterium]